MRTFAGIICIIAVIAFFGLPVIGFLIVVWLFVCLAEYAAGGKNK